jgi:hypothetical protein
MPFCNPQVTFSAQEPDPAVSEGICSVIYAAPRAEVKGAFLEYIVYCKLDTHWFQSYMFYEISSCTSMVGSFLQR